MDRITLPAQVIDLKPRADRSWKLTFETRELKGKEVELLADNFQGEGWLLFKPNSDASFDSSEIPAIDADAGIESPSMRLRKRLFVLWRQRGKKGTFENFYLTAMQKYIEHVETQLEGEVNE